MIEHALDLASSGWAILPLSGKVPRTTHGVDDATTDLDVIRSWWTRWPDANIGARVDPRLVVLDIDPRNGGDLDALNPTPTLTCWSGRRDGGGHLYYRRPRGELSSTRLPRGVDLKLNGYLVMPPSTHPETGHRYTWHMHSIAALPGHLRELLTPPSRKPASVWSMFTGGKATRLVDFVAEQVEGNRNNALFWAACRAAEDGTLDQIEDALVDAAVRIGIPERSARAQIASARKRGAI